jgi:hypothetical protein
MLNYNYNWIEPLQKTRNFLKGKLDWAFRLSNYVADNPTQIPPLVFGTGSIEYTPYSATTLFISGSSSNGWYETGSLTSGSALGIPVKIALTGSGVWPLTGSNIMAIVVGGNLGFNQSTSSIQNATQNNFNLSGSKISSSFSPLGNQQYNLNIGISHIKGNIYNPLINWNAQKTSAFGNVSTSINGETSASFNLVKNTSFNNVSERFTSLSYIKEVSGSAQSSSFYNEYSFSVTASYTASINNVTGSTTMSFDCPQEGINKKLYFFNPNVVTAIGSASFVASNNTIHYFSSSINYNKGNINNGPINWSTTNISPLSNVVTINGYTSSFNLVKDKNVSIVNYQEITGSRFGGFLNDYAFNFTSSLTASIQANATGSVTMSLDIPEAGISTSSILFSATSAGVNIITASFDTRNENPYNITASVIFNKGNISNTPINWLAGSTSTTQDLIGNSTNINGVSSSFRIVKDVNVQMVSVANTTGSNSGSYLNNYAFNQTASIVSNINNTTGSVTMSISIPEAGIYTSSIFFNPNTTQAYISASFESQTNVNSYNITASIINNKGNQSNSNIFWSVSGSGPDLPGSSSLNIRKDANVTMVTQSCASPLTSSYTNLYAFNQTASISSSFTPFFSSDSSSWYIGKLNLDIPEINYSKYLWISSSKPAGALSTLTASFVAQTNTASYHITASVVEYKMPTVEFLIVGGGGAGSSWWNPQCYNSRSTGGGAGGLLSGSIILSASISYPITVGIGGAGNGYIGGNGTDSSFYGLVALGGGGGGSDTGNCVHINFIGSNGGSGGGNGGLGTPGQGYNAAGVLGGGGSAEYDGAYWVDGFSYAAGGGGSGLNGQGYNYSLPNGIATGTYGRGGQGGTAEPAYVNGKNGVVKIRYKSDVQLGTGGAAVQSGSYWYHTFTDSGSFSIIPILV